MYIVYLKAIRYDADGKICNTEKEGTKELRKFTTQESAKAFYEGYDFESAYNEEMKKQGDGTCRVMLYMKEEYLGGEIVLRKKFRNSFPGENEGKECPSGYFRG